MSPKERRKPTIELVLDGAQSNPALPHVLLVVDEFSRTLGGGERVILRLAELLPMYGYRVSILTLGLHPESAVLNRPAPCPIYLLRLQRTYGMEAPSAAWEVGRFLRRQNVRIVQTFFESSDLWVGTVAKITSSAKLIWSRRDMGILRGTKHRIAYRWLARLPDAVFAVSDQVRQHVLSVDRVDPKRVETVYSGLDLEPWLAISPRRSKPNQLRVVTVGNVRHVKGHDVLIRATAQLVGALPGLQVQIAGEVLEPEYYAELQSMVDKLGLQGCVRFVGGITDLRSFLTDADLFVLPSRSEGFSNAIVEAMAAALPVVATDVGGNAEAIVDEKTGRIVPPDDENALAAAMGNILAHPDYACAMGMAGRDRVAERFTSDAMMRQITAAYRRLLRSE